MEKLNKTFERKRIENLSWISSLREWNVKM